MRVLYNFKINSKKNGTPYSKQTSSRALACQAPGETQLLKGVAAEQNRRASMWEGIKK
jgi:transposase-like protein